MKEINEENFNRALEEFVQFVSDPANKAILLKAIIDRKAGADPFIKSYTDDLRERGGECEKYAENVSIINEYRKLHDEITPKLEEAIELITKTHLQRELERRSKIAKDQSSCIIL